MATKVDIELSDVAAQKSLMQLADRFNAAGKAASKAGDQMKGATGKETTKDIETQSGALERLKNRLLTITAAYAALRIAQRLIFSMMESGTPAGNNLSAAFERLNEAFGRLKRELVVQQIFDNLASTVTTKVVPAIDATVKKTGDLVSWTRKFIAANQELFGIAPSGWTRLIALQEQEANELRRRIALTEVLTAKEKARLAVLGALRAGIANSELTDKLETEGTGGQSRAFLENFRTGLLKAADEISARMQKEGKDTKEFFEGINKVLGRTNTILGAVIAQEKAALAFAQAADKVDEAAFITRRDGLRQLNAAEAELNAMRALGRAKEKAGTEEDAELLRSQKAVRTLFEQEKAAGNKAEIEAVKTIKLLREEEAALLRAGKLTAAESLKQNEKLGKAQQDLLKAIQQQQQAEQKLATFRRQEDAEALERIRQRKQAELERVEAIKQAELNARRELEERIRQQAGGQGGLIERLIGGVDRNRVRRQLQQNLLGPINEELRAVTEARRQRAGQVDAVQAPERQRLLAETARIQRELRLVQNTVAEFQKRGIDETDPRFENVGRRQFQLIQARRDTADRLAALKREREAAIKQGVDPGRERQLRQQQGRTIRDIRRGEVGAEEVGKAVGDVAAEQAKQLGGQDALNKRVVEALAAVAKENAVKNAADEALAQKLEMILTQLRDNPRGRAQRAGRR